MVGFCWPENTAKRRHLQQEKSIVARKYLYKEMGGKVQAVPKSGEIIAKGGGQAVGVSQQNYCDTENGRFDFLKSKRDRGIVPRFSRIPAFRHAGTRT